MLLSLDGEGDRTGIVLCVVVIRGGRLPLCRSDAPLPGLLLGGAGAVAAAAVVSTAVSQRVT